MEAEIILIDPKDVTIGESFSWITDNDGDVMEITGVTDDGVLICSGKLNDEQKARWKRITTCTELQKRS